MREIKFKNNGVINGVREIVENIPTINMSLNRYVFKNGGT